MPALDSAVTHIFRLAHSDSEAAIMISQDGAQQDPAGRRVLYILGFGIAGTIFMNAAIFAYFALFYASF